MMSASIVIPTFNRPQLVGKAVHSACQQSVDCEVIVVDSSQPAVNADALIAMGRPGQVRYLRFEPDVTLLQWAYGIAHAKGEACMVLADDDWLHPQYLEKVLPPLSNPQVAYCISASQVHGIEGYKYSLLIRDCQQDTYVPCAQWEEKILGVGVAVSPHAAIFRRKQLLDWLPTNPIPGVPQYFKYVGCDMLITLLPMKHHVYVYYCSEILVNFGAWRGSITTGAVEAKQVGALEKQYAAVKHYYKLVKPHL
jgi:glycosyltransferase involved in cell wall biosynthesis